MTWLLRKKPVPELVASVDLGSNSFHMIVCRIQNEQFIVVDRLREMVRLAAGIDAEKRLSEQAQQRALDCLTRFGQRLRDLPHHCVRIVGTNTLRSAQNSAEFIEKAEQQLGHPIDIISGVEEARLIYLGVAHSLAADDTRRLVMDIGGGSTELIIGEQFTPLYLESLYMGCVSMSQRFFSDGVISNKRLNQAQIAATQELEPVIARFKKYHWQQAIGASGTIRAIHKIVQAEGWSEDGITLSSLEKIIQAMLDAGDMEKLQLKGLDSERTPVFAGGLVILYATFIALGIESMRVSDGALREGLIHDLLGRIHHEDIRAKSTQAMAKRYHVDLEQVERVQTTANYLFEQAQQDWKLSLDEHYQWLNWAALLYEIGLDIAHSHYQKHGAYIIKHADLAGFSTQEQALLSTLVLAHRRKLPIKAIKSLPKHWQKMATQLTIILRLATLLHRSRMDLGHHFQLSVSSKKLQLSFEPDWLTQHSLTAADLEQEAQYLSAIGYKLKIN